MRSDMTVVNYIPNKSKYYLNYKRNYFHTNNFQFKKKINKHKYYIYKNILKVLRTYTFKIQP